jgi:hypothetical protein
MTFNCSQVSIIGIVTVGVETEDKPIILSDAWHVSILCVMPRHSASHDIYACMTNECVPSLLHVCSRLEGARCTTTVCT